MLFSVHQAGANSLFLLVVIFVPMVMSGSLMNTVASSIMTKKVPEIATGMLWFVFVRFFQVLLLHCQK